MHEAYWGLKEPPFSLTPDPRFLYMSRAHEDALMMLHYAITRNKGAAMLSGDIGLGKTTISRKLLDLLDPVKYRIVMIVNPILTPVQMLQEIFRINSTYTRFLGTGRSSSKSSTTRSSRTMSAVSRL